MKLTVYHLKSCDTCRKAVKALQSGGNELTLIDVRADGMPLEVLERVTQEIGWEIVLNRRSTTWRGLDDTEKANIDTAKAVALMAQHPTLIKRPVILSESGISVGWSADVKAQYI